MVRSYEDLFVDAEARRRYLAALDVLIESARRHGYNRDYVGLLRYRAELLQRLTMIEGAMAA